MATPTLYGICLVKNEDDVLRQSLTFALNWCEKIFVIDNGSTDRSWNIVKCLAREHSAIIPFIQTGAPFSNSLRSLVYNEYHSRRTDDDWWLTLDADEFLAEDPRPLIHHALKENAELIRSWQIHFYFTDIDYRNWVAGKDNRDTPIQRRRRYYRINWQETRLFRNRSRRAWDTSASQFFPDGFRRFCRRLILNRHYQFRDPEQIQKRIALRFGNPLFPHVPRPDWQSTIVPASKLNYFDENDRWRFSVAGLAEYYSFVAKSMCRAGVRKLRNAVLPFS